EVAKDVQPEVFPIEPKKGLVGLRKVLGLRATPRTVEGVDIAHLGGNDMVASLVAFVDGLPFKPGYRRVRRNAARGGGRLASRRSGRWCRSCPAACTTRKCPPRTSCSSTAARGS